MNNSASIKIYHWSREDGDLSESAMRAKFKSLGYQCHCYHYPPGTYFPEHEHEVDKIDGVLQGKFCITLLGESIILTAGDYLFVPKGVLHSAEVVGSETVKSIDAVAIDS